MAHGVDMIELDVLPEKLDGSGELWLAHDYEDARERTPLTLEEGLGHLAGEEFAGIELIVDLKLRGYELRVLQALEEHGLKERAMISSQYRQSLHRLRAGDGTVRLGWSIPRARRDYTRSPLLGILALIALRLIRLVLPRMARSEIRSGLCNAIVAQWRLVSPRLVAAVADAGGELYAWTVDDASRIRRLQALGVTGIITNDPRLFGAPA